MLCVVQGRVVCPPSLCSSVHRVSIKRKNKAQSHNQQPHDVFEELCYSWSDELLAGRVDLSLEHHTRATSCKATLPAKEGTLKGFPETSRRQLNDGKEGVALHNVKFGKIILEKKAWREKSGVTLEVEKPNDNVIQESNAKGLS